MRYGVMADSHDNFYNLEESIKILKERKIQTCFHLGDFCAPSIVKAMVAHEGIKWICVWGNVDGDKGKIVSDQCKNPNFDIAGESFREVKISKDKIFLTHFPLLAEIAAKSGIYKAVFYGHNHIKRVERLENGTLLVNPGEIVGSKTGQPSFGIWDPLANQVELVDLKDFRVAK